MSVLILGDPHIGRSLNIGKSIPGSQLNSRVIDQLNLLDWVLEQAIENHCNNIIITGDIFEDPKPAPSLVALFMSWIKKCELHEIHVHIIMGNHDIIRNGTASFSPLDIIIEADLEFATVYKNISTILIDTSAFTIIPFRDRKYYNTNSNAEALNILNSSLVYELSSIPITYQKFVVGHLAFEGSLPIGDEIDDLGNELFCPLDFFNGYDAVWMGHIHKPQIMKKKPYLSHIGSMDISHFGETDHIKFITIVDTNSTTLSFKNINIPTRNLKSISITVPESTIDTTKYVIDEIEKADSLKNAIVRVDILLDSPDLPTVSKNEIEKYLISKDVFNISNISQSKKSIVIKKISNNTATLSTKMDISSTINSYAQAHVPEKFKNSFIEIGLEILNQYKNEVK